MSQKNHKRKRRLLAQLDARQHADRALGRMHDELHSQITVCVEILGSGGQIGEHTILQAVKALLVISVQEVRIAHDSIYDEPADGDRILVEAVLNVVTEVRKKT